MRPPVGGPTGGRRSRTGRAARSTRSATPRRSEPRSRLTAADRARETGTRPGYGFCTIRHMPSIRLGALCWNQYTSWPGLLDAGIRADALGYDTLWTWDHVYPIVGDSHGPNFEGWLT